MLRNWSTNLRVSWADCVSSIIQTVSWVRLSVLCNLKTVLGGFSVLSQPQSSVWAASIVSSTTSKQCLGGPVSSVCNETGVLVTVSSHLSKRCLDWLRQFYLQPQNGVWMTSISSSSNSVWMTSFIYNHKMMFGWAQLPNYLWFLSIRTCWFHCIVNNTLFYCISNDLQIYFYNFTYTRMK